MLRGLGAHLAAIEAPFDPEPSAPHWPTGIPMAGKKSPRPCSARPRASGDPGPRARKSWIPACAGMSGSEPPSPTLYRLMAWLSPSYPVGAFSYSSGIEWAVEAGDIKDAETLRAWLAVMLAEGAGFCDAVLFAHAHRAVAEQDDKALRAVAELAAAFAASRSAIWKPPRKATPSSRRRAPPGRRPRSTGSRQSGTARSPIRWRSRSPPPATASRSRRRSPPSCRRSPPIWSPPACGWSRSARPTASACWPRSKQPSRATARARRHHDARRHRLRRLPRRPRRRQTRDAIHAAVQELEYARIPTAPIRTAPCASASAARSAPARPR